VVPGLLNGRAEVLSATVSISAYLFVVGVGVRAIVAPWVTLPRSAGVTLGLGAAITMATGSLAYRFAGNAEVVVWPLVLLAGGVAAAWLLRSVRGARLRPAVAMLAPTWCDLLALVLASAALAPIIRHGLAVWTMSIPDFPNYAGSAELWADGSAAYHAKHPDLFGELIGWRAGYEKPALTALLVVGTKVTGHGAIALLTPLTWLFLFVLLASLAATASALFRGWALGLAAAVAVPALSILPMSRVFDGQIGHVATAAIVALALVLATTAPQHGGIRHVVAWAVLSGTVIATAIMANVSLFLGSLGLVGPLLCWVAWRVGVRGAQLAQTAGLCLAVTAVLALPFAGWFETSLRLQAEGGFAVPFTGPAALVGLQRSLGDAPPLREALVQWGALLAVMLVWWAVAKVRRGGGWAPVVVGVVGLANLSAVVLFKGFDTYQAHKWLALAATSAVPLLLAGAVSSPPERLRVPAAATALLVCVAAVVGAASVASDVPVRVSAGDLEALSTSPTIVERESVNIDLGDITATSSAAFAVPNEQVVALGRTYVGTGVPIGSDLLVRSDSLTAAQRAAAIRVSPSFSLVDLDLSVPPDGVLSFAGIHPENRVHLGGRWLAPGPTGIWTNGGRSHEISDGESATVALDLDPSLRGRPVRLTITGYRFVGPGESRPLVVMVDDRRIAAHTYTEAQPQPFTMTVPAALTDGPDGRLEVTLTTPDPLSPADFGATDERRLGFFLSSLQVVAG
jgi:hypothetical protein